MADMIDLRAAVLHNSPNVVDWPITRTIRRVIERPIGGFELQFDREPPPAWKWPSNPAVPTDHFLYTVWAFVRLGDGRWHGAGFINWWTGRDMNEGGMPAIFKAQAAVPGYRDWWGDVRMPWGELSHYVPQPGSQMGLMVSAGHARMRTDVTSVAERSNVVTFPLPLSDSFDKVYVPGDEEPGPVDPPPPPPPPVDPPPVYPLAHLEALLKQHEDASEVRHRETMMMLNELAHRIDVLRLSGHVKIFGASGALDLAALPTKATP